VIGCNPLAYTIHINNLGATPGVSAADIDPWLEPLRRPAELRDRPRHELMGANPQECGIRLLGILEAECNRLVTLADRVREDVDIPSLCESLNRVCLLTDKEARRAARAHTEARINFRQAANDLTKALDRAKKAKSGHSSPVPGPLSSVQGHSSAKDDAGAEAAVARPEAADVGPVPADEILPPKPERASDAMIADHHEAATYVDARVSTAGCAKMRKTDAQPAPRAAQTVAKAPVAPGTDRAPGPEQTTSDQRPMTDDQGPMPHDQEADRRADGLFAPKPENTTDPLIPVYDESITYVDARLTDSGCAKMRKTAAQPDPPVAQTGSQAGADAGTDPPPESDHRTSDHRQMTNDQGPMTNEDRAPGPVQRASDQGQMTNDPVLALIGKYQKEFDAALRPYDHLH
jgi:hypothetical protein